MKNRKNNLIILALSFIIANAIQAQPLDPKICQGAGLWEFGTKTVGPKSEQANPFISDAILGPCKYSTQELEQARKKRFDPIPDAPRQKLAIFTIGGPGSGKSSSIEEVLKKLNILKNQIVIIDPDDLRDNLSDFKTITNIPSELCIGKFRAFSKAVSHCINAGRLMRNAMLALVLASQKNFIFDSPCAAPEFCVEQMKKAQEKGFLVYVIAVYAPLEASIARVKSRALLTGRYTEESFVQKTYEEIRGNFMALATIAIESGGKAYIFDNSQTRPRLVFEMNKLEDKCDKNNPACAYFVR